MFHAKCFVSIDCISKLQPTPHWYTKETLIFMVPSIFHLIFYYNVKNVDRVLDLT
jgi:hypothetical protein